MKGYPTKGRISACEYRSRCTGSEAWSVINDVATGKRTILFPKGGLLFAAVGFLIVVPASGLTGFVSLTLLSSTSAASKGMYLVGSSVFLILIHAGFMIRVSLGFIYAQQYLVRYLASLVALSMGCGVYGMVTLERANWNYLLFPLAAAVASVLMLWTAQSERFTGYAELMRAKRVYLKQRKNQGESS